MTNKWLGSEWLTKEIVKELCDKYLPPENYGGNYENYDCLIETLNENDIFNRNQLEKLMQTQLDYALKQDKQFVNQEFVDIEGVQSIFIGECNSDQKTYFWHTGLVRIMLEGKRLEK
ncbi:MAG: hypothetical protein DWQ19_12220 [Crenarchaeota archaeon]|nr:MAG: hypothetical protein DWQ19_12220 [Thermoproteota archaeon]